ncbi:hypothetical protein DT075_01695 [Bacillus licheniformis]|nr:hypothetical protein DT075_01695 [Bacillus licheniformis]
MKSDIEKRAECGLQNGTEAMMKAFSIPEFQDVRPVFALQFAERALNPHFHLISGKTLDFFPLFVLEIMARRWRSSFVSVLISFFELFTRSG